MYALSAVQVLLSQGGRLHPTKWSDVSAMVHVPVDNAAPCCYRFGWFRLIKGHSCRWACSESIVIREWTAVGRRCDAVCRTEVLGKARCFEVVDPIRTSYWRQTRSPREVIASREVILLRPSREKWAISRCRPVLYGAEVLMRTSSPVVAYILSPQYTPT